MTEPRPPASKARLPHGEFATVLDALCARFPAVPREQWAERMRDAKVLDEAGCAIEPTRAYSPGLRVQYFRELACERPIPGEVQVLHVDAHLIIADKPHFLPVMPAGSFVRETLLTRLIERFDNPGLTVLHRIDRATAGLVMLSCNERTRAQYQALFRERRIVKRYEALAPPLEGRTYPFVHRSRIGSGPEFFRTQEMSGEPNSETIVDVASRGDACWRYLLTPVTGRKHQLRVHMAALGAPLLGDRLYPVLQAEAPDDYSRPLQLLARSLSFRDPLTGEPRHFTSQRALVS